MSEASIFANALEKNPEERAAYLAEACAGDEELRQRVEALLRAHAGSDDVLPPPPGGSGTVDFPAVVEKPGGRIGPYKLLEQIGEGGFGLVFVAEQQEPVRRKVALKVIKPGMDTRQVIARFEAERQALAMMDHPNIAKVLDAGATDSGRPFFVMELVRGIPITDYCDQHRLDPRERLELFVTVCQAIQHAHQKGVIHRDIKPSNVLVTSHDGKPVAKVIDFGVAKAIGQHLTERTIYTQFAQMIGTPQYMSPEQAEMSGLDIDTRSDIYSLGVLLYELLTGTTPLEKKRLAVAAYDEIRRLIRSEDPPPPSKRLSTCETLPSVAANRNTEPAKLARFLRGEVDWIVMKALEKDRTRRYETARDLGRDIERYLRDDPVEARPTSALYRLRKLVRRNKGPALAISLILLALMVGIAGTTWGMWRAERNRKVAVNNENDAKKSAGDLRDANLQLDRTVARANVIAELAKQRADETQVAVEQMQVDRGLHEIEAGRFYNGMLLLALPLLGDGAKSPRSEKHRLRLCSYWRHGQDQMMSDDSPFRTLQSRYVLVGQHQFPSQNAADLAHVFSPDGRWVVTPVFAKSTDQPDVMLPNSGWVIPPPAPTNTLQVRDVITWEPVGQPLKHDGNVLRAVFSPDGNSILTVSGRTAQIWEVRSGRPRGAELRHQSDVQGAWFSTDSRRIVTESMLVMPLPPWGSASVRFGQLRAWNANTGQAIGAAIFVGEWFKTFSLSPNCRRVLIESNDPVYQIWDFQSGSRIGQPIQVEGLDGTLSFSPDGERIVNRHVEWDANTGQVLGRWPDVDYAYLQSLSLAGRRGNQSFTGEARLSQDGSRLIGIDDGGVTIWDTQRRKRIIGPLANVVSDSRPSDAALSPDGRRLVYIVDAHAQVCDSATGKTLGQLVHQHDLVVVRFSPDSRRIITADEAGIVRVWECGFSENVSNFGLVERYLGLMGSGELDSVLDVSFDGRKLIVLPVHGDGCPVICDLHRKRQLRLPHPVPVREAKFTSDGRRVVTITHKDVLRIWDTETSHLVARPVRDRCVAITPDGRRVLLQTEDKAWIREVDTGKEVFLKLKNNWQIFNGEFGLDGRLLATASGNIAQLWETRTGRPIGQALEHDRKLFVKFSPNGRCLITIRGTHFVFGPGKLRALPDSEARIWYLTAEGTVSRSVHLVKAQYAEFSHDGQRIVTMHDNGTVNVWDVASGQRLVPPLRVGRTVEGVGFAPDDQRILTWNGTARVWDATTGQPVSPPLWYRCAHWSVEAGRGFAIHADRFLSVASSETPSEDWVRLTQFFVGVTDRLGAHLPMSPERITDEWNYLRTKYPQDFTVTPEQARAWHRREAAGCLKEKNAWAAVFHLVHAGDLNLWGTGMWAR